MADILETVLDIAKKLRKSAKKSNDPQIQSLITDLNLSLADLKVQLVEQQQAHLREQQQAHEPSTDHGQCEHREPSTSMTSPQHRDPAY